MQPLIELLAPESIDLGTAAHDRDDAVRRAGAALLAAGSVKPGYVEAMLAREHSVSTFVGEGIAMPHGRLTGTEPLVIRDALAVLRFADAVDWNGEPVTVAIGIAARGRGYIGILSRLATILLDPENAQALRTAGTAEEVYAILGKEHRATDHLT